MEVLADQRCSFLGNVTVGKDVSLERIQQMYHAVDMVPCDTLSANVQRLVCGHSHIFGDSLVRMHYKMRHLPKSPDQVCQCPQFCVQIVLAYGAEGNRQLQVPGQVMLSDLRN